MHHFAQITNNDSSPVSAQHVCTSVHDDNDGTYYIYSALY